MLKTVNFLVPPQFINYACSLNGNRSRIAFEWLLSLEIIYFILSTDEDLNFGLWNAAEIGLWCMAIHMETRFSMYSWLLKSTSVSKTAR